MPASTVQIVIQAVNQASGPISQVNGALQGMGKYAQQAGGQMTGLGFHLGKVASLAEGVLIGMLAFQAVRLPGQIISTAIEAYAAYERLGLTLNNLMAVELRQTDTALSMAEALAQTKEQTKELVQWTEELAIYSPFTQETVTYALQQAMGFGMNAAKAKELTQALIDYAAGTGRTEAQTKELGFAIGQVFSKGRLTAEEMNRQLTNAGMGVAFVADALGMTTKELSEAMERGEIGAERFTDAIIALTNERFEGAAKRQATSWAGLLSTMQDITTIGLRSFFEGTFKAIQPYFSKFLEGWPDLKKKLAEVGNEIGQRMGPIMESLVTTILPGIWRGFASLKNAVGLFLLPIKIAVGALRELVGVLGGGAASKGFMDAIASALGPDAVGPILGMLEALRSVGRFIADTLVPAFRGFFDVLLRGAAAPRELLRVMEALFGSEITSSILGAMESIRKAIADNLGPIVLGLAVGIATVLIPVLWAWAISAAAVAVATIAALLPVIATIAAVGAVVAVIAMAWRDNWGDIQGKTQAAWEFMEPILLGLKDFLGEQLNLALATLSYQWNFVFYPALKTVWEFLNTYVLPVLGALANVAIAILKKELEILAGIWQHLLLPALQGIWDFIERYILPVLRSLADMFASSAGPQVSWFTDHVLGPLKVALDKIKDVVGWVVDRLRDLADAINNLSLPDWLRPGSPTPFEIGLRGISTAMRELTAVRLPELRVGLAENAYPEASNRFSPPAPGMGGPTYILNVNSSLPTRNIIQDFTLMQAIGARAAGRAY